MPSFDLTNRNAIVTGGSRNMGRSYALALAGAGANVAILDLPEREEDAASVGAEIRAAGQSCCFIPVDIQDMEAIQQAVSAAVDQLGNLHVLINNAGKTDDTPSTAMDYAPEALDDHYRVMVRGTFFMTQAVGRHMIDREIAGSIVNIASRVGQQVQPNSPGYSICKAAVIHMSRVMAQELGPYGIRVNAIGPGSIPRPDLDATSESEVRRPTKVRFLMGRPLEFDDLAGTALYLASDASEMITGQFIIADGGLGLRPAY
ncbi:MAG: SDR family oxidoreductase [Chloroflexi bacterium]|nr:SDR family oxidoreductase [Chloroflexota bacterium]